VKSGDLVTLSTYALLKADMWKWKKMVWDDKKPLVGLVVRVEPNPYGYPSISKNEKTVYYVKWMQQNGPMSRWGNSIYHTKTTGYFLRNDLKFVK
jgi:hypothetical protein